MIKGFVETFIKFLDELAVPYHMNSDKNESVSGITFSKPKLTLQLHMIGEERSTTAARYKKEVHLWEDQWIYHQEKIKSKIRSLLGLTKKIHGRQTAIIKLNNDRLIQFLRIHHLNVAIKAKYKYGLIYNDDLVAVMSFSRGRPIRRHGVVYNSFELLRYCNRLNTTVVGGVGKLLNHFIREQSPDDIMTYIDADWSDGKSLVPLGFRQVEFKNPIKFYLDVTNGEREYEEMLCQKLGLRKGILPQERHEEILRSGYKPIYNSGSYKYILDVKLLSD